MEFDPLNKDGEESALNVSALCPREFKHLRHAMFTRFAEKFPRTESHFTTLSTSGSMRDWRV
jgi:hypothetical protein